MANVMIYLSAEEVEDILKAWAKREYCVNDGALEVDWDSERNVQMRYVQEKRSKTPLQSIFSPD